nr:uncharacterized protein LOC109156569 [Ipomoea batatas]
MRALYAARDCSAGGKVELPSMGKAMEMALRSKNKMVLVDGTMVVPSRADPKYFYWDQCQHYGSIMDPFESSHPPLEKTFAVIFPAAKETPQEVSPTNLVLPSKGMNCLDTNEHLPEVFEPADDLIQPQGKPITSGQVEEPTIEPINIP